MIQMQLFELLATYKLQMCEIRRQICCCTSMIIQI